MLKIIQENSKTRLALFCDYCRKEITDGRYAMFAWKVDKKTHAVSDGEIYFFHKGVCDRAMTDADNKHRNSLYDWHWWELTELPHEIIQSIGITWELAQGELNPFTVKDTVKSQLLQKELREWEQSALPLRDVEDVEGE